MRVLLAAAVFGVLVFVATASPAEIADKDVHRVARAIKASTELDRDTKLAQLKNLKEMDAEIKELEEAEDDDVASDLKKDIAARMSTLKRSLGGVVHKTKLHHESHAAAKRVGEDIQALKTAVQSSHLAPATRREAEDDLAAMENDLSKLEAGKQNPANLKTALSLRAQALHQMLEESEQQQQPAAATHHKAFHHARATIQKMEEQLHNSDLDKATRKLAREDLQAMKADLATLESDSNAPQLKRALKLRFKALKEMLQ